MNLFHAIILGLVEGLTEYLPVSSTGHLLIVQKFLGLKESEASNAFAVCVQAGAILAVLSIYFNRAKQITLGFFGKDKEGKKLGFNLIAAFLPVLILGCLFGKLIQEKLFGLYPILIAWIVGGVAILYFTKHPILQKKKKKEMKDLTVKDSFLIGFCQCFAMWPGTSRSLVTIAGGLIANLKKEAAIEFSFLLGGLTLFAASIYTAIKHHAAMINEYDIKIMLVGLLVSWAAAWVSVKWMIGYLKKHNFNIFGYWRIIIAISAFFILR